MLRLLCITAHPDDEAGGFGGSLLFYQARGVETYVVCLTDGQAATHRGEATNGEELAATRRREFVAACKLLKVTQGEVLDYPDGGLDRQDFQTMVADLTRRIRKIRPHVVLTFGPEGGITAHPDHSMASIYATMAFHWAGRTNRFTEQMEIEGLRPHRAQKLYYATAPFLLPDRQPIAPPPASAIINVAGHFETKLAAFRAHTSQAPLFPIFESFVRSRGPEEQYLLAAGPAPKIAETETDLFAGVVEE